MSSDSNPAVAPSIVRRLVFAALMLFSCVSLHWYSPYVRPYSHSLIGLALSIAAAAWLGRTRVWRTRLDGLSERIADMPPRLRRGVFVWGFAAPTLLAFAILDPIPHIPDGFAYLFQAKLFTLGRLWADSPDLPAFFPAPWSVDLDGRVFTVFPPGWPALLAIGVAIGAPVFVNPALGALALAVMWHLWEELFDSRRANLALVLCALSPFYLFMSASFMSHNASLLASSAFALAFLKSARTGSLAWALLAALSIAFQILVRPASALFVFAAIVGFMVLKRRTKGC